MGTLLKKRVLSVVSAENFDNGIVEEINAGQQENIVEEVEGIQDEIAADIQAVENLEGVEAEMSEAIEQGEANIAAMGGEEPAITETTVVNEEGNVETVQEQVEPTLDQNSTDGEVAQATMELENSMESWAGKLQGERLQEVYNSLLSNKQVASFESLVKNPRASYHVSVEGVKDMAKAAGQAIMNFLKSIWEGLKKLFGKILVLCSGLEKKFMALKKEVAEIKPDGVQLGSDEKTKEMLAKIEGVAGLNLGEIIPASRKAVGGLSYFGNEHNAQASGAQDRNEIVSKLASILEPLEKAMFKKAPSYDLGENSGNAKKVIIALGKDEGKEFSKAFLVTLSMGGDSEASSNFENQEVSLKNPTISSSKEVYDIMMDAIDSGIKMCRDMKAFKSDVDSALDGMMKAVKAAKGDKKHVKPIAKIINRVSYQVSKYPASLYNVANTAKKLLTGKTEEASEGKEESTETK